MQTQRSTIHFVLSSKEWGRNTQADRNATCCLYDNCKTEQEVGGTNIQASNTNQIVTRGIIQFGFLIIQCTNIGGKPWISWFQKRYFWRRHVKFYAELYKKRNSVERMRVKQSCRGHRSRFCPDCVGERCSHCGNLGFIWKLILCEAFSRHSVRGRLSRTDAIAGFPTC